MIDHGGYGSRASIASLSRPGRRYCECLLQLPDSGFLSISGHSLEYRMIGPRPDAAPTIVMLHEGLGCAGLWGDFPGAVQQATGCGVFVYSRAGYGQSSPVT